MALLLISSLTSLKYILNTAFQFKVEKKILKPREPLIIIGFIGLAYQTSFIIQVYNMVHFFMKKRDFVLSADLFVQTINATGCTKKNVPSLVRLTKEGTFF